MLNSPGVADMYPTLTNTWNTLPETFQQRLYKSTLATVKCQIQQAENPTPVAVISTEAACVDNAILLAYLTSEVVLEEPDIRYTDRNIPIENIGMDDEQQFGMPGGSEVYDDESDEIYKSNTIPTASRGRWAATEVERFHLGISVVHGYVGDDDDYADADEEEEASQADDGLTPTLVD
jgi:hypothetical protein